MTALRFDYGGKTGLFIAKPGYSLDTPNLPREAFAFNSDWGGAPRILEEGVSPSGLPTETVNTFKFLQTTTLSVLKSWSPPLPVAPLLMTQEYVSDFMAPRSNQNFQGYGLPVQPSVKTGWGLTTTSKAYLASGIRYKLIDHTVYSQPGSGGAPGTWRVYFSEALGFRVAADPYDAATETDLSRFLIHPDKKLLSPVKIGTATTNQTTVISNPPFSATRWRYVDVNVDWTDYDQRFYVFDFVFNALVYEQGRPLISFPDAQTMRLSFVELTATAAGPDRTYNYLVI